VKTVMKDSGVAIMGSGKASGEGRALRAVGSALESPLLNDNDITGANFILLNITFGSDELLMDEISLITDHIQEQAGDNAEVIWGYGQDPSLGEDICVTVIATGFKAKTVDTGVLRQEPVTTKFKLDQDTPKEVTARVEKPISNVPSAPVAEGEPFLINREAATEINLEISNVVKENTLEDLPPQIEFKHKAEPAIEEKKYFNLEDVSPAGAATDSLPLKEQPQVEERPARQQVMALNKEREMRIREVTLRLKTPNGVADLENEPAYVRKRVNLDPTPSSGDSQVSRYTLSESVDENGEKKTELKENPFLHTKVD
jgi:cell division protein FtsZ